MFLSSVDEEIQGDANPSVERETCYEWVGERCWDKVVSAIFGQFEVLQDGRTRGITHYVTGISLVGRCL
jgi:hypothetical protein